MKERQPRKQRSGTTVADLWQVRLRHYLRERRISDSAVVSTIFSDAARGRKLFPQAKSKGRDGIVKILGGDRALPLNPKALIEELALAIAESLPGERPTLEKQKEVISFIIEESSTRHNLVELSNDSLRKIDETHSKVSEILNALVPQMGEIKRHGVTEPALRAIVARIEVQMRDGPIDDILLRIDSFVEAAMRESEARKLHTNEARDLLSLRTEARAYLDKGQLDKVSRPFDIALEEKQKERVRRASNDIRDEIRLLEEAAEYDRLAFNIDKAVDRYVQASFLLSPIGDPRYITDHAKTLKELGTRLGDANAILISIQLIRILGASAKPNTPPSVHALLQHTLAAALVALGDMEPGNDSLNEAVSLCRRGLKGIAETNHTEIRAHLFSVLGEALRILGERERDDGKLNEAMLAFEQALKVFTRDKTPDHWAFAKNGLATAQVLIALTNNDVKGAENSIVTYCEALDGLAQTQRISDCSVIKNNLSNAVAFLGTKSRDSTRINEAVEICHSALGKVSQSNEPFLWGNLKMSLGCALHALGQLKRSKALLKESTEIFQVLLTNMSLKKERSDGELVKLILKMACCCSKSWRPRLSTMTRTGERNHHRSIDLEIEKAPRT